LKRGRRRPAASGNEIEEGARPPCAPGRAAPRISESESRRSQNGVWRSLAEGPDAPASNWKISVNQLFCFAIATTCCYHTQGQRRIFECTFRQLASKDRDQPFDDAKLKATATQRAGDLKAIVDDIKRTGITSVRGIAEDYTCGASGLLGETHGIPRPSRGC
jgi:hypothetical protein